MMRALVGSELVEARPGLVAVCPGCAAPLVPKCGYRIAWHWAHRAEDCDSWHEPMSAWHSSWQEIAPEAKREVVMQRDGKTHRADVVLPSGFVLELQASPIAVEDIQSREAFYGRMLWLFEAEHWLSRVRFTKAPEFWWQYAATSQLAIRKPLLWDVGEEIWQVRLGESASKRVTGSIARRWNRDAFIRDAFGVGGQGDTE